MSESEPELPLPLSPPLSHEESDSSSSSSSSSPSRSTNSDIEKQNIPSPHSDRKEDVEPNLDEIPYPAEMEIEPDDVDIEIPLPPDSSKYSPSQALAAGDDDMASPSDSPLETKKVTTTVLGKVQAKKRLMAFSAAKLGATAATAVKKISPTKASLLQRQQQQQQQQQLAIATIKEEETKMKEILAMNSILNEKLKQVNALTTNIPTQPPATAVVKPTLISTPSAEALSKSAAAVSASVTVPTLSSKEIPPLSSIVVTAPIRALEKDKERRRSTKNLRKARHSTSSSRSRSHSRSVSKSRSRSAERERDRDRYSGRSSRRRGRKSRSGSPSRSKESERGSGRDKDRRGATKKSSRRSQSRSPNREKEKEHSKDREGERIRTTKEKDRDRERERDRHRRKSKSRTHSPDIRVRKRTSKEKEREGREKERVEREREKEKEREREREKEREKEEKKEAERKAERELDKVRKARMPTSWTDYRECQYRTSDVNFVWNAILNRTKSRSPSNSHSPDRVGDVLNPTPLSRSLTYHSKDVKPIPIEGRNTKVDYPSQFNRRTKTKPTVIYGISPLCFDGLYKSRATIFEEEDSDVVETMKEIINFKSPKESLSAVTVPKSREWFAASDQQFCPVDGGKGILISHLYSDDDQSREDSPLPVRTKGLSGTQKSKSKLLSSEIVGSPSRSPTPNDSENDSDSAPSPLLKRKYNNDDASSFILEKEIPIRKVSEKVREPERISHRDSSSECEIDNSSRRVEEYSSRKSDQSSRRGEDSSRRSETSRRGDEGSRRVEDVPRRGDEFSKRGDESSRRSVDSFKGRKEEEIPRKGHEIGKRGVEPSRRDDEPSRKGGEPYRRNDESSRKGDDRRIDESSRKPQEVSSKKLPETSDRRKYSDPVVIKKLQNVSPLIKLSERTRGALLGDDKHYREGGEISSKIKAKWVEGGGEQSDDELGDNADVNISEKTTKKDKKLKKKKKKHHKHKHSKKKHESSDDDDNIDDGQVRPPSPVPMPSKRSSLKSSESSKEKGVVGKAHKKRKSRAEVKGTDEDSHSSSSEEDDSDDSSNQKPKKKRPKTEDEKLAKEKFTSKDKNISTSSRDKSLSTSKSEVKRSKVSPAPNGDKVKEKLKNKKKKREKEKEKKSKKKHSKKTRSTTSPSEVSGESESDDASSNSSSSEEDSSGDEGSSKGKKRKLKKKSKSPKKDKGKGKGRSPPTTDDEHDGGGMGRPPGSSGGGGSSNSKPERKDRDTGGKDKDRDRDRDSGRDRDSDRGRDRNQGGGRPRRHNIDDLEEGELTTATETSDLEGIGKVKESPYLCFPPVPKSNSQEEEEIRQQSMNPVNPNPNPKTSDTEEITLIKNLISDSEKETHTLISEFDDDAFLQSVLEDEDQDLSAEALILKLSSTNSTDQPDNMEKSEVRVSPKKGICTNWSDDSQDEDENRESRSASGGPTSGYGTGTSEKSFGDDNPNEVTELCQNLLIPDAQSEDDSDSGSDSSSEPTTVSVTPDLSDTEKDETKALYDPFDDIGGSSSSSYSTSPERKDLSPTRTELSEIRKSERERDNLTQKANSDIQNESPSKQKPFNFKIGNAAKIEKSKLALFDGDIEEGEIVSESNMEVKSRKYSVSSKPVIPFGQVKSTTSVSTAREKKSEPSSQKLSSVEPVSPKSDSRSYSKSGNRLSSISPSPEPVVGMPIPTLESGKPVGRRVPSSERERDNVSEPHSFSRHRTESRSPSRSYTPPPHQHGHTRSSSPPPNLLRERDMVRRHPRLSPPPWVRGRRGHHPSRHETSLRFFDRHHRRVPRSRSRSPTRSRSRSRSLSRSRSRSRSPRSSRREPSYEKKRREYLERARRIDSNRHFTHHGGRFAVRMGGRFRRHGHNYHQYGRVARSPPPPRRFEGRKFRRDEQDLLDEHLHEEGRRHVEERETEKLASVGPGPRTPTGEPPAEMLKDSPPLQLNVADSTISDSELANATAGAGNAICEIETINSSVGMNRDFNESDKYTSEDNYNNSGPYCSPPRRLSLDERLEMEMGISLRDEPPMQSQFTGLPPNYRGEYGFGQHFGMQGKFPPLPILHSNEPPRSDWGGFGHDFKKPGFQGHGFGEKPGTFGTFGPFDSTQGPSHPPRTQSQIVQVGNVIQVVPAELPSAPITITSTSKTHVYDGPSHLRIGASRQGMDGGVRNRVVTIKVPVLPFTIPMIQPEDMPTQNDEPPIRRRSKPRNLKRRRPEHSRQTTKDEIVSRAGKGVADVGVETPPPKEKEKEETLEPDEIISEEEIALLKEAMSATPGESETHESDASSQKSVSEDLDGIPPVRSRRRAPYSDDMDEADEGETDTVLNECEKGEKSAETKNAIPIQLNSIHPKKVEILPAPSEGILVAAGWDKSGRQRKSVKFADGINPGYGTSPSCGEEMTSPPAPSFDTKQRKSSKERSLNKKKKIKVKIVRKGGEGESESVLDRASPPPCPCGPYPFCPPGILYQVCPQYAVLYAQAVAEKGFDIVFEPSTQLPYLTGGVEEISSKPANVPNVQAESSGSLYLGQYDTRPSNRDLPITQSPHYSPYSNFNYSNQERLGERIPTIMNLQAMNSPPPSMHPLNSLQEQVNAIPLFPSSSEPSFNSATNNVLNDSFTMEDDADIELPVQSFKLDEIPLPTDHSNNIYISPAKIPIPDGTPPIRTESRRHSSSSTSHSRSHSPDKSKKTKKFKRSGPLRKKQQLLRVQESSESISIPLAKIVSDNSFGVRGEFAPINRFVDYDFTPYTSNRRLSLPTRVPAPVSLPPGIDLNIPPPGIDLHTPPPGIDLNTPPPGIDVHTPPPIVTSIGSSLIHLSPGAASSIPPSDVKFPGKDIVSVLPSSGSGFGHFGPPVGEAVSPSLGLNVPTETMEELDDTGEETPPPPGTTP